MAATLAAAMGNAWAPTWYPVGTHTPLIVRPEHARTFAEAGWSKADLRRSIFARCRRTAGDLRAAGTGELTPFAIHAETDDTEIPKFLSEDEIVIVVAGGDAGRLPAVLPPWIGFGLGSTMITREVHRLRADHAVADVVRLRKPPSHDPAPADVLAEAERCGAVLIALAD